MSCISIVAAGASFSHLEIRYLAAIVSHPRKLANHPSPPPSMATTLATFPATKSNKLANTPTFQLNFALKLIKWQFNLPNLYLASLLMPPLAHYYQNQN